MEIRNFQKHKKLLLCTKLRTIIYFCFFFCFFQPLAMDSSFLIGSTPSPHSPTPSPVSSAGSSSGYSSDKRPGYVPVPTNIHMLMFKQHGYHSELISCLSSWNEADQLIFRGNKGECKSLSLTISQKRKIQWIREISKLTENYLA